MKEPAGAIAAISTKEMADELHTTIYDNTEAASDTREDDVDLNRLAQLTAWLVIRKKHFYPAKHRKWHDLLYGE